MQKETLMIALFALLVLSAGCKKTEDFDSFCATKVRLDIENLEESYSNVCFSENNKIDFILSNNGKTDIEYLNIEIYGTEKVTKYDLKVKIAVGNTRTISLNVPKEKYGQLRYIVIYPYVTYDNSTKMCKKNRRFLSNLPNC